jgi:hypothetical protein
MLRTEKIGMELESTEEIEDSEEFKVLDNESKDLNKLSKKKREKKKILIEKVEEQSEKDWTVVGKVDNSNNNKINVVDNNNNNNNNTPSTNVIPISYPKPKSLTSQLLTLTTTLGLVKKAKCLEEAIQLPDDTKQYFSFNGEVFKCNGYFSKDKIFEEVKPNLWWIILVGLIPAVIFTVVLNSYWPILINL